MAAQDEARQASDRFYAALSRMLNGDAGPLSEVWSHASDVTTMHPIGGRQVGWEQVRPVWEQVAHICSGGQVRLDDQLVRTGGDLAYEVGTFELKMNDAQGNPTTTPGKYVVAWKRQPKGEWKAELDIFNTDK